MELENSDDLSLEDSIIDNYYYTSQDFVTDSSSVNTDLLKKQKLLDYKTLDKGYNSIKQKVNGKFIKIEFYNTNYSMGTTIRNAVTGIYQKGCYMGTLNENLFFKVSHASAENKNKEPKFLFFDDPEQWERHFVCTCPSEIKKKWYQRKHNIQNIV
jgi:hypothetical protein